MSIEHSTRDPGRAGELEDSDRAMARADLRWLLAIAEAERLELLDRQDNSSRERSWKLGQAMRRVETVFLG